jgi:hypothetical protein
MGKLCFNIKNKFSEPFKADVCNHTPKKLYPSSEDYYPRRFRLSLKSDNMKFAEEKALK